MNGRAKDAQKYPDALCRAICRGLTQQIIADKQGQFLIAAMNNKITDPEDMRNAADEMQGECRTVEEDDGI